MTERARESEEQVVCRIRVQVRIPGREHSIIPFIANTTQIGFRTLNLHNKHERTASTATLDATNKRIRLLAAVEVVPLAASAAPVIVGCLGVGKVVGILGLHVVEASGLVEVRGLCVEGGL